MQHDRKIIYWAGFLFSLPLALTFYVNSSFLSSFVGEKLVGVIFALASACSILALLLTPAIFRKIGAYWFLILSALGSSIAYLALTLMQSTSGIIVFFVLGFSFNTLILFTLDEFLKIFSRNNAMGRVRGIYLSACHVAYMAAQLGFAIVLGEFSLRIIYFVSILVMLLFLVVTMWSLRNIPDPKYDKVSSFKFLKRFLQSRNLGRAYVISFLLQLFYAWMIIYTPLYLSAHLGFSWRQIGLMFAIMFIPFLVLPFRLGEYGDKFGERKILMLGFTIAAISTLCIFFINSHSVFLWAALLLATRIGASSVEVMSDAYFFKHITSLNEEFVGVYRSASPVAYILGPLLASLIFILVPSFKFIYLVLAALMLIGTYLSSEINKQDI